MKVRWWRVVQLCRLFAKTQSMGSAHDISSYTAGENVAGHQSSGEPPPNRPSKRATFCQTTFTPGLRLSRGNNGKPKVDGEEPSDNSSGKNPQTGQTNYRYAISRRTRPATFDKVVRGRRACYEQQRITHHKATRKKGKATV